MRRHPAILLLLTLALAMAACGGDDSAGTTGTSGPAGASTTGTSAGAEGTAAVAWYTDRGTGAVARWNLTTGSCDGITQAGLSADLMAVGLGWVWVTDCTGSQLVRLDITTGEVTGRVNLGSCPSALAIAFDLVWVALPSDGKIVAVDPVSGVIVAEGTSDLDAPMLLAAGSLHITGSTYYWRLDEVAVNTGGGGDVWEFKLEDAAATYTQLPGQALGLAVSASGGNDTAGVLVGPPADGQTSTDYSDPTYPSQLYDVGSSGAIPHGDPLAGFYSYLGAFDSHYVATSKVTGKVVVANGAAVPIPVGAPPGPPVGGPPPPGDGDGGTGVWVGSRDPEQPGLWYITVTDPPASLRAPQITLDCQSGGETLGLWDLIVLSRADIAGQQALADAMDRTAFAQDPFPEAPVTPTVPTGPRFDSCSVGYEHAARLLNGMEGKTVPGATVVLSIEFGTLLYDELATTVADTDGSFTLPDFDLDDLTTPIPAGSAITVALTADGYYEGACRIDVSS
jgi:hypothetical protein